MPRFGFSLAVSVFGRTHLGFHEPTNGASAGFTGTTRRSQLEEMSGDGDLLMWALLLTWLMGLPYADV
ncbi:hypothetical protein ACFX13_017766 [Malus domestica]